MSNRWWKGESAFRVGGPVTRKENPRHVGKVRAVIHGGKAVRVEWSNGWLEDFTDGDAREELLRE